MMAMREKLIELLKGAETKVAEMLSRPLELEEWLGVYADHLVANGVTIPVHCHECEHWKNEINGCTEDKRFCNIGYYMVHKDGFCSFGKRKDDGNG